MNELTYDQVCAWIAQQIVDSSSAPDEVDGNAEVYMDDLADTVKDKAAELAKTEFIETVDEAEEETRRRDEKRCSD